MFMSHRRCIPRICWISWISRISRTALIAASLSCSAAFASGPTGTDTGNVLTILYIGQSDSHSASGVRQGVQEGNLQGAFLGFSVDLIEKAHPDDTMNADVIITDQPAADLTKLLQSLPGEMPVINASAADDDLRDGCHVNLLHTIPTDSMLAAATSAWREKSNSDTGDALAWHPDFKKFAARDLNKRYKAAHNRAMNSAGWAGWAASRLLTDAYARGGINAVRSLAQSDRGDGFGFDGQKGRQLSFLANGQMQQLLLIDDNGRLLGEAPGLYPASAAAPAGCR